MDPNPESSDKVAALSLAPKEIDTKGKPTPEDILMAHNCLANDKSFQVLIKTCTEDAYDIKALECRKHSILPALSRLNIAFTDMIQFLIPFV